MGKFDININLNQCKDAFFYDIQGRDKKEKCICIPVYALAVDKKGNVWLNVRAIPSIKQGENTHFLNQILTREQYSSIPVGENGHRSLPIVGSVHNTREHAKGNATAPVSTQPDEEQFPF